MLGDYMRERYPELLANDRCPCKDFLGLANSWGPAKTLEQLPRLVHLVKLAHPRVPIREIDYKLRQGIASYSQVSPTVPHLTMPRPTLHRHP